MPHLAERQRAPGRSSATAGRRAARRRRRAGGRCDGRSGRRGCSHERRSGGPVSAACRVTGSRSSGPGTRPLARIWMLVQVLAAIDRAQRHAGRRGVIVGRGLLDLMAEPFEKLRRALDGRHQHGIERRCRPPACRMKATRSLPGARSRRRQERAGRRRGIGIAGLAAGDEHRAGPRCRARRSTRRCCAPAPASVSPIGARLTRPRDGFRPNRPHERGRNADRAAAVGRMRHRQAARRDDRPPSRRTSRRATGPCARD